MARMKLMARMTYDDKDEKDGLRVMMILKCYSCMPWWIEK
jgi:hypothetical protein